MQHATTRIVRFHETGGPEVLKIMEEPLPTPGPGEVRLRVHAIGLNRAEVMFRSGAYLITPSLPSKNGYEASGIVEAVGPGVDSGLIGKTASTVPCFDPGVHGVYGEVAIVPASALAVYPDTLSFEEGASIWMQYLTAWGALVHYGHVSKGDHVVITAASSSVGLAAIQTVRAQGGISIALTRTPEKKETLLQFGADHVIVTGQEDVAARVAAITGHQGARIVFDPVAGKGVEKLAELLAQGGILFEYGNLSGESSTPFPLFAALKKGLTVRGYTLFEIAAQPDIRAEGEQYIRKHLASGALLPHIARIFTLDEIVEAHRYMESNAQIGKIVVRVANHA